jgi:peptide-methionine (R)-S-oxide reductase
MADKLNKSNEQWRIELDPESYFVLREKGTEKPFSGKFNDHHEDGTYVCKGCGAALFSSENKFDSRCGWPSYYDGIDSGAILTTPDYSHGMVRTEITCANCGGHLGHVFEDGPQPTGLRYCVNSLSLDFKKKE